MEPPDESVSEGPAARFPRRCAGAAVDEPGVGSEAVALAADHDGANATPSPAPRVSVWTGVAACRLGAPCDGGSRTRGRRGHVESAAGDPPADDVAEALKALRCFLAIGMAELEQRKTSRNRFKVSQSSLNSALTRTGGLLIQSASF